MHLSSINDGTHLADELAFFDDWLFRILGHQSEHHIDTITSGRLLTFDPPPVLFDVKENALSGDGIGNFGVQVCERETPIATLTLSIQMPFGTC